MPFDCARGSGAEACAKKINKSKEPALRKGLWVNSYGIHKTGPALRKAGDCQGYLS
jgi:hypothetical protein